MNRVIITGSSGLIGQHVTQRFVDHGVQVHELDLALGHDLTDEAFVREWFAAHPADGLINLFAMNDHVDSDRGSSRLLDVSLESVDQYLHVNVTALLSVCREFARNNSGGSIVNFTSTYGLVSPRPDLYDGGEKHVGYGLSKAAVVQLTRHLAVHLAPRFRVNCVAPGGVRHRQGEAFRDRYARQAPMGRMMEIEELFGVIEFLVSDRASYCTGGVYMADGGWTAW